MKKLVYKLTTFGENMRQERKYTGQTRENKRGGRVQLNTGERAGEETTKPGTLGSQRKGEGTRNADQLF